MSALTLLLGLGVATAAPISVREPVTPIEWDASLVGTWARFQANQHLRSFGHGRASLVLHEIYAVNSGATWGLDAGRECSLDLPPIGCVWAMDGSAVLTRQGEDWRVDGARPRWLQDLAIEADTYVSLPSAGPFMGRYRPFTVNQAVSGGLRVELDAVHLRVRSTERQGWASALRVGPTLGYQFGAASISGVWLPLASVVAARNDGRRVALGDRRRAGGFTPTAMEIFIEGELTADRSGWKDWVTPELRLRRTPVPGAIAGAPEMDRAWVHEITFQIVAILL
jgi:hypothetical protein